MGLPHIRKRFKDIKDIVVYSPSGKDIELAHKRSCRLGASGALVAGMNARMAGFLGEVAVCRFLGVRSRYVGNKKYPYDIVYNDIYFFTRVKGDYQSVYLCGWLPSPTFFDEAEFIPKGTFDDTGFLHKMCGYHIKIGDLSPARAFKKEY